MGKYAKLFKAYKENKIEKFKELFSELTFADLTYMMEKYPKMNVIYSMFQPFQVYWDKRIKVNKLMVEMFKTAFSDSAVSDKVFENDRVFHSNLSKHRQAILSFLEMFYFPNDEKVTLEAALVQGIVARFNDLIQNMKDLLAFVSKLKPVNAIVISEHVISDFKLCDKLINSLTDLYAFISVFPRTIFELVPYLLAKKNKFQQLVGSVSDLSMLIKIISKYTETPEKLNMLINNVFEICENDFKKLIKSLDDIEYLHKKHPSSTAFLVKYVLSHQGEYDRLVKSAYDQQLFASLIVYSGITVLDKDDRRQMRSAIITAAKKHVAAKKETSYDPRLLGEKKAAKEAVAQHEDKEKLIEKAAAL